MKSSKKPNNIFRTLLSWSAIIFFGYILFKSAGDYRKILETIQSADFVTLGWIVVLCIGNLSIMTSILKANFAMFEHEIHLGKLLPEVIAFSFMTISNPLGPTGAGAFMIQRLVESGHSYMKSLFAFLSTQLSVNLAFFPFLGFSFWYLSKGNLLNSTEIAASIFLVVTNLIIMAVIFCILILPKFSISVADFVSDLSNSIAKRILKKSLINSKRLSNSIRDVQTDSLQFDTTSLKFLKVILLSLAYHSINFISLYMAFQAYGTPPSVEIVVCIYSIIVLFSVVSPTPQGIGIVEGFAQIGAISIGVESEFALVAILTYRATTIWLPALLGFVVFRASRKQHATDAN